MLENTFLSVLLGTGFTFAATSLGAAIVFFFKKEINFSVQKSFIGFAAGVMMAASIFSLLVPAIAWADTQAIAPYIPVCIGFALGWLFIFLMDLLIRKLEKPLKLKRTMSNKTRMLILAITLHNIPEGMAVGLAFALCSGTNDVVQFIAAATLALGIGIQNFPEGAAVSLPLKKEGYSNKKAFLYGALTAIVEPIAGLTTLLIVSVASTLMPWLLAFSAGAMVYVVFNDLIPEAAEDSKKYIGISAAMIGFILMMWLDVMLG